LKLLFAQEKETSIYPNPESNETCPFTLAPPSYETLPSKE